MGAHQGSRILLDVHSRPPGISCPQFLLLAPSLTQCPALLTLSAFPTAALGDPPVMGPPTVPQALSPTWASRKVAPGQGTSWFCAHGGFLKNVLFWLSLSLEAANSGTPPLPDFTNAQKVIYLPLKCPTFCMVSSSHIC